MNKYYIYWRLRLQSTYKQKQIDRNLEPAWNYYCHTHLVEGIFMLLLLVNKVVLSQRIQIYTRLIWMQTMKIVWLEWELEVLVGWQI